MNKASPQPSPSLMDVNRCREKWHLQKYTELREVPIIIATAPLVEKQCRKEFWKKARRCSPAFNREGSDPFENQIVTPVRRQAFADRVTDEMAQPSVSNPALIATSLYKRPPKQQNKKSTGIAAMRAAILNGKSDGQVVKFHKDETSGN